jgi:hypothetical protein
MGWDVAQGTGATPSCACILDVETGEQVGEYANAAIQPKDLAYVAAALGWLFSTHDGFAARQIYEKQGPGVVFGGQLLKLGYSNVYFKTVELPKSQKYSVSDIPGWDNTAEEFHNLFHEFRSALQGKPQKVVPRSELMVRECLQIRYNLRGEIEHGQVDVSDDPSRARVSHADRAIAGALAWKEAARGWRPKPVEDKPKGLWPAMSLQYRRDLREAEARAADEA